MAAPTVYKSSDTDAPTLDGQKGSLINVLKACLVDGYSSGGTAKSGAGWTVATGPTSNKIIFRNNSTTGSGLYFRIQDDGRIASGGSSYHTSDRACNAALVGMASYSGIDTPTVPFPRVIAGGSLHSSTAYGVTIRKVYSTTNPTYARPWMVVADDRTCWLVTTCLNTNTTTLPTARDTELTSGITITGFGDIRLYNSGYSGTAKGFVLGGPIDLVDVNTGNASVTHDNVGYIGHGTTNLYLNRSIETAGYGVEGYVKFKNFTQGSLSGGGVCTASAANGNFVRYPSYANVGMEVNPIIACEYTNDSIRTNKTTFPVNGTEIGILPGLLGCPHTTYSGATYRIGNELSEHTQDGVTYLVYSQNNNTKSSFYGSSLLAFDLSDWWD